MERWVFLLHLFHQMLLQHLHIQVLSRQASALQLADENSFNLESEVDTCVHVDERFVTIFVSDIILFRRM